MNNFWRRLRTAWHFWKFFPSTTLPNDYWTDADARAWSNFLISDPGIKYRHMKLEKVNLTAQRAIMEQAHPEYLAGVAWGTRCMVAFDDGLLRISPPTSESSELTESQLEGEFRSVNR